MRALLFLLLLSNVLLAQQDTLPDFKRLQVGITLGQFQQEVDFSPGNGVEPLAGTTVGLALRYFDRQLIGFQAEVTYSGAGWREDLVDGEEPYERATNYTELLILTQLSPGQGFLQPMLQAGPYLSVPLSEKETIPGGFDPSTVAENAYYGRELNFRLNYGLQVAAGFNLELGPLTVQASGRAIIGFSDLIKPGESQALTSRRQGFGGQVGVFYAL